MADWTAPFHMPKFTDDDFERQKDAYNAKHGYQIVIPSLDDIIILKPFHELTPEEAARWKAKDYNSFTPERLEEIRAEKRRRKAKFQNMLASPSPEIVRQAGAIMTSLDDTQDALATLATVGLIAAKPIGGQTAKTLLGPLGWILTATELLNLINPQTWIKLPKRDRPGGRALKRQIMDLTDANPFSKKAKAKTAKKVAKFRPSLTNLIEPLQVTNSVFGFGVSLGPIMGLAQDIIAGTVRYLGGQQVSVKLAPQARPNYTNKGQDVMKANAVLHGQHWQSDLVEDSTSLISGALALQALEPYVQDWNPYDQVIDLQGVEIQAPRPKSLLTQEILTEDGFSIEESCNWPQNGQSHITLGDLYDSTNERATANFVHYAEQNRHEPLAFCAAQNTHNFALGSIEAIEGPGSVIIEYDTIERIVMIILDNNWSYPDDITQEQIDRFTEWCLYQRQTDHHPNYREIYNAALYLAGFRFVKVTV